MSIYLTKGQKVDLTKQNPKLDRLLVGVGWEIKGDEVKSELEVDAFVFLCDANGKCLTRNDFIFYGNLEDDSGVIKHLNDNLVICGPENEQIQVNLGKVKNETEKIIFVITIYEANKRNQNFGQIEQCFIRLVDVATNEELLRYDLVEGFSNETAVVVGEIYRYKGEWKFNAIGSGFEDDFVKLCDNYGIKIE